MVQHGPLIGTDHYLILLREPPASRIFNHLPVNGFFHCGINSSKGERHCISAVAFVVAGGGFEPPTFGLCDLTHLSVRVGLYLHPRGVLAIQSLRLPQFQGLGSVLPYRSRALGSTDFDE